MKKENTPLLAVPGARGGVKLPQPRVRVARLPHCGVEVWTLRAAGRSVGTAGACRTARPTRGDTVPTAIFFNYVDFLHGKPTDRAPILLGARFGRGARLVPLVRTLVHIALFQSHAGAVRTAGARFQLYFPVAPTAADEQVFAAVVFKNRKTQRVVHPVLHLASRIRRGGGRRRRGRGTRGW